MLNCEHAQSLIARHLTRELSAKDEAALVDHLHDCARCRQEVEFHKSLASRLAVMPKVPDSLAANAASCLDRVARPGFLSWLSQPQGANTMKKVMISTSAIAAIAMGTLFVLPHIASAATPLSRFNDLRTAIRQAANRGEIKIDVFANPNGSIECTGTLDGLKLPDEFPMQVEAKVADQIADVTITIDFDPSHFTSIKFGQNEDTLKLVYKDLPNRVMLVQLDPKTHMPKAWKSEKLTERIGAAQPAKTNAKAARETVAQAKVRLRMGQHATVIVTSS